MILLVNNYTNFGLLNLICVFSMGGISDSIWSEGNLAVLGFIESLFKIFLGMHQVALINTRLWRHLWKMFKCSFKFRCKSWSMTMVTVNISFSMIDLWIFVEGRLSCNKELTILWMMTEYDGWCAVILHGQVTCLATGLHVLMGLH